MEKERLEKYWRLRLPIFIAFIVLETLGSQALYEHCNSWKLSGSSAPAPENSKALTPAEQLRKIIDINKKTSGRGER